MVEVLEPVYSQLIEILAGSAADALLWSANVDEMITYPAYFEKDILPWCRKASQKLQAEGILTIVHPDGENLLFKRGNRCPQFGHLNGLAFQRLPGTLKRCLLGGNLFILDDDVMNLKDHHLAVVPVGTIRVFLQDLLKTLKCFGIVSVFVFWIGKGDPHLEEKTVRFLGIVREDLRVVIQGSGVLSLVE